MKKTIDICIVGGCGHVGLPLGLAFAHKGKKVALYDINQRSVEDINNKKMPFMEEGGEELLIETIENNTLFATTNPSVINNSEFVIVTIGTPVDEYLNPRIHDVMDAIRDVEPYLHDNHVLILRSTLYPGVTKKIEEHLLSKGKQTGVAFCPERIAEGLALKEFSSLPQIVSAFTNTTLERARNLFLCIANEVVELSPLEAELAKLFTNSWRYIIFSVANQFYMTANSYGLDFYKIRDAMIQNYPRLQGFPKAGFAAGPCLFKDTMQLSAFNNNNFILGHAAMLTNEGLPGYIIHELKQHIDLSQKTVGILGMAFKKDHDDARDSLSFKLKKLAELEAKEVLCTDEYIQDPELLPLHDVLERADILIIGAPHTHYKSLSFQKKILVDIWNIYGQGSLIQNISDL